MRLRTKTALTIFLISVLILGASLLVTFLVIQPSFSNVENQECKEGVNQAIGTIDYRLSNLEGSMKDYSFWDETYNFVQNGDQQYVDRNFVVETFENLNLNLIAIISNNKSLIYFQSFDLENSIKVQTSEETKAILGSDDCIWSFSSLEDTISGLMIIDNRPMLIATGPILTSLNQGPKMGGLLFGRFVDAREISQLAEIMNLNFSLDTLSDFRLQDRNDQLAESLLSNQQSIFVKENGPDSVSGYALIRDVCSEPNFILQVNQQRIAYQQGILVRNIFLLVNVVLAFSFGAAILFIFERSIVKPMTKLAAYVKEMPLNGQNPEIKTVFGTQETDILANVVRDTMNKKLEAMNEVSRMVGHDLRNPLTGIKGATYVLKNNYGEKMDSKGKAMIKTIENCLEYSDKIVKDLSEYSGEVKLNKNNVPLEILMRDSLAPLAVPKNINLIDNCGEFSVLVDNGKIERVFSNLIKNAFDAMPDGGKLEITSRKVNNFVEIAFCDSGVGMSKEVLEKLWTPFFTTKAKGLGVGLSICKRIIDAHGGRIEVHSSEGKGTCFAVFLPLNNNNLG